MATAREQYLHELKVIGAFEEYFEGISQILDQLTDEFPMNNSQYMPNSEVRDRLMEFKRSYQRRDFVER